jgi:hypothetical protein
VIDVESSGGKRVVAQLTDVVGIGVLTRLVTRELVDDVLVRTGTREERKRGLPARIVVYFVLAMALFSRDSYEEVMRKLVQGLRSNLIVKKAWKVPTSSAFSKARVRLGIEPMREIFDMVAVPCAMRSTPGAWKRGRRLMAIDGVEIDAPDTPQNAERFGYSGVKKEEKSAFVKVPAMALAECGTHAVVEVETGTETDSKHSLADRLITGTDKLEAGMLVLTDRGLYSYHLLTKIVADLANDAVLQTVPRTINTGLGVVFILAALLVLGGDSLADFALALLIGIGVGTYSSMFTATPLAIELHHRGGAPPPGDRPVSSRLGEVKET